MNGETVFEVSQVNAYIKDRMDGDELLGRIYVRGELSNYKVYSSGHHYFTLKDAEGVLKAVMFRGSASKLRFKPDNGMKVIAFGRVTVFPRDGAYQLYVTGMTPDGVGDLHVAFEQLKEKLYKEGLFDAAHKQPLPRFPMRIALITSASGAAVHDMLRILRARFPMVKVLIMGVRVQGAEAPAEIVGALRYANRHRVADLIITGRGGGSIEDLWAFNDERVAREIYNSKIPVISAVGHEPDVTISDFVADLRAATPSNAAELAVPDSDELRQLLDGYSVQLAKNIEGRLRREGKRLSALAGSGVMSGPTAYIAARRQSLEAFRLRLTGAETGKLAENRRHYVRLAASLDALSPLKVLGRGYAIARLAEDGEVVRSVSTLRRGDMLKLRFADGEVCAEIKENGDESDE